MDGKEAPRPRRRRQPDHNAPLNPRFTLQYPGTAHGPCADITCAHSDCARKRLVAGSTCGLCGHPVGFLRFWELGLIRGYVHQECMGRYLETQEARIAMAGYN